MNAARNDCTYTLPSGTEDLLAGTCPDPFSILGRHPHGRVDIVRAFCPDARGVRLVVQRPRSGPAERPMRLVDDRGLYVGTVPAGARYRLKIGWADGWEEIDDPYSFGLLLGDLDLHLFTQGLHRDLDRVMGAQAMTVDGVAGVRFAVWAPNAFRVSVIGDFNVWDGRRHPMRLRHAAGIWELFIPGIGPGERYKYEILDAERRLLPPKADPMALAAEQPPATASVVADPTPFEWTDAAWMENRQDRQGITAPLSIYEVHAASWRRPEGDPQGIMHWDRLERELIPYVVEMGFSHIELMPIMEHPFDGSWGYQTLGLYAPSARFGSPRQFASFVNACHNAGLGVILDWVPAHFPSDAHGLALFDGSFLYEHQDRREGFHPDWNTLIYNFGRHEIRGFLIGSALMWLRRYHIDGLRVDAVASMLYRDYSRREGEWISNIHGGRENLEAIAFLRGLNTTIAELCPSAVMMAEESTAWPGVSQPVVDGGLGFSYKWNMGWMHDTLAYMSRDPIWRRYHHSEIMFGLHYAFSERFVLPLSHDEVVHGKGSLIARMPGDEWRKHAGLRAYFAFMWAHPGKKLLFMGGELAQPHEWHADGELAWYGLAQPLVQGVQTLVRDVNRLYAAYPALHRADCTPDGFAWVIGDDSDNAVFAWLRMAPGVAPVLVVCNMTPIPRPLYRIGVPCGGYWRELLNTDAGEYAGSGMGNGGGAQALPEPSHGYDQSCVLVLPPLAVLYLSPESFGGGWA
ncbi:1,4-alpha-glucan branching protein GlgB [Gluconacetobacter diazotrophicus]|uniref:1,4-alpha-glucan branching enzyme GlgB n=1 Tax=Gluconacetobacter diazotrophicus TaxID=33996 RepID=A0A7W4FCB1_GLUDI|nr:1,4-alpha-glucan branching protein GlgB [Gluconacetobacter diazotrophicus]MBB2155053.1 1,4-alpha-glucan branching protein GlgB [Gluconacetobacter diazotrophicus]